MSYPIRTAGEKGCIFFVVVVVAQCKFNGRTDRHLLFRRARRKMTSAAACLLELVELVESDAFNRIARKKKNQQTTRCLGGGGIKNHRQRLEKRDLGRCDGIHKCSDATNATKTTTNFRIFFCWSSLQEKRRRPVTQIFFFFCRRRGCVVGRGPGRSDRDLWGSPPAAARAQIYKQKKKSKPAPRTGPLC